VGAGIGNLPGNATASNFGKQNENASKENVAFSLFNMVAETGGVCACLAAEKNGFEKIVFVGRTSTFSLIQKRLETTCQLFNKKAVFPTDAEYATAIGAALQYKQ
jgi:type II pantothenate kinase